MSAALSLVPDGTGKPVSLDRQFWRRWAWTWTQIARIQRIKIEAYEMGWKRARHNREYTNGYQEGNRVGRVQGVSRIDKGTTETSCAVCHKPMEASNYWIDRCVMLGRDRDEQIELWRAHCAGTHGCRPKETTR